MVFSVILPVYNVEKYIKECVDSIIGQTFTDYEVILVDDGCVDSSGAICDEYAKADKRIKVIHQKNSGAATARNAAAKIAKGDYIIFIDSDDYILSDKMFEAVYEKIKETSADIVFYKHKKFFDDTKVFCDCAYSYKNAIAAKDYPAAMKALVLDDAFFGMPWNKAFKRELMVSNGIFFPEGKVGEDMDWMLRLCAKISSAAFIDSPFIAYRQRGGSVSNSVKYKSLVDFINIMDERSKEVSNIKDNDTLRSALLGALAKYYCNMLITYIRVNDSAKKQEKKKLKNLSWLLDYGVSKRPLLVKKAYRLFGFNITLLLLKILDKVK